MFRRAGDEWYVVNRTIGLSISSRQLARSQQAMEKIGQNRKGVVFYRHNITPHTSLAFRRI